MTDTSFTTIKRNLLKKIDSKKFFAGVIQVILTRKCTQIGLAAILITIGFSIRTENTLLAEEYRYPTQILRTTPANFFSESYFFCYGLI